MRPQAGGRLYFPLVRGYRRKATRIQIVSMAAALLVSSGSVYAHLRRVVQPSLADFALWSIPYQPWYLDEGLTPSRRSMATGTIMADDNRPVVTIEAKGFTGQPSSLARLKSLDAARPNLVPEPDTSYSLAELTKKIESYVGAKAGTASKPDLAARAQELAESYASSAGTSISTFPLPAALERSVLEQRWLWDLREGCDAGLYTEFPAGRLDAMGCGLVAIPLGKAFGVGVTLIDRQGTGRRPVIAVVWENK